MEEATLSTNVEELFNQICIPEIFSAILRHLTLKERRNLRLCSTFIEDAVSRSDLRICGAYTGYRQAIFRDPNTMCISANFTRRIDSSIVELALSFGGCTILRRRNKDEPFSKDNYAVTLTEVLHMRKRLCSRIFVNRVAIINVNFNIIPMDYIESLLAGCVFNDLTIVVKKGGYCPGLIDLLRKYEGKDISLTLQGFTIDMQTLMSLKPMDELILSKTYYVVLNEDEFIDLVKKGHKDLKLPSISRTSSKFVQAVIENMSQSAYQWIEFKVGLGVAEFFLLQIGYIWDDDRGILMRIGPSDYTTVRNCSREYSSYLFAYLRRTCGLMLHIYFPKYPPGPGRSPRPRMVRITICRDPDVTSCAECKSKHCVYEYHDDKHIRTVPQLN